MIVCDDWSEAQVKAFRLMVNRSVTWADWDESLLSLELQELRAADFSFDLTGFDPGEIAGLLAIPDEERANDAPPLPENPVSQRDGNVDSIQSLGMAEESRRCRAFQMQLLRERAPFDDSAFNVFLIVGNTVECIGPCKAAVPISNLS